MPSQSVRITMEFHQLYITKIGTISDNISTNWDNISTSCDTISAKCGNISSTCEKKIGTNCDNTSPLHHI